MKDKPREHRGKKHAVPESRFSWWRHITWWRHMLYLAFFVVGASCATYYSAWDSISKLIWKPDVALTFSDPRMTIVSIWNVSSTVVQKPKYAVNLVNVDEATTSPDILPMGTQMGDYIQPWSRMGPNQMVGMTQVKSHIKEGDRLVGWAYVMCPECPRHNYIVYIKHGIEGWYAEIKDNEFLDMNQIGKLMKDREALFKAFMASVPQERRISIIGSPYSAEALPLVIRKKD
jgi:hypothetical protein